MEGDIEAATKALLYAANDGEFKRLKKTAAAIDRVFGGGGIPAVIQNTKDDHGRGAIHYAATGGSVNVLRYLIQEIKLDVNLRDGDGATPLSRATIRGHLAAVEYLLEMGANPEIRDHGNFNPLHFAALKGHEHIIPLLLSKGIDVDVTNHYGSPLHYAASFGTPETVKVLLDHGANPNLAYPDTFTPLWASMPSKYWQCAEQLLKGGADPNGGPDGLKPLKLVATLASVEATQIIKLLVEAGADPNTTDVRGLKPVEIAALSGNYQGVGILFPVTSPISSYVDWSTDGIMKHVNSEKFEKEMNRKAKEIFLDAKSRGTSAFQRKEYWLAVHWYSEALQIQPGDAAVLSNRSLGYMHLKQGDLAFEDATKCIFLRPDWPKAFYRAGKALKLLNRFDDAAEAFLDGLKLAPNNKELEDAFREVTLDRVKATNVPL